jgi:hypothetical protein
MTVKAGILVILVSLCAPVVSFAQSSGTSGNSIESLNIRDIADDSIVVLSKDDSGTSGYVNIKYAFIHAACADGVQLIHYSGPAFDVNDRTVLKNEQKRCSQRTYDESSDD